MARAGTRHRRRMTIATIAAMVAGSAVLFARPPAAEPVPQPCILWQEPANLEARNLFYGPGGEEHQPTGDPYTFVEEDLDGTNPKFVVRDDAGTKWKIK